MSAPADKLLGALTGVKRTGEGRWIARCPSHNDKSPSLAIKEEPDGRLLIHCFAGCGASEVLGSVGLELKDLYPEPLNKREGYAPTKHRIPPRDILKAITREAFIVAIAASDMAEGKAVDANRVALAAGRIATALTMG